MRTQKRQEQRLQTGSRGKVKEKAVSWTLKIMHIFSELLGQFCMHSTNRKERKGRKQKNNSQKVWQREKKKVIVLSARPTQSCCLVTINKCVWGCVCIYSRGCLSVDFGFQSTHSCAGNTFSRSKIVSPRKKSSASNQLMELCLLFTISVDRFPKASKWDGINRSVSLPGSQAFCYIPSQPGKAAYLKINFKISPKTPTVNHSFLYFIQCH